MTGNIDYADPVCSSVWFVTVNGKTSSVWLLTDDAQQRQVRGRATPPQDRTTAVSSCAYGLFLLGDLLDHPKEEVGVRLFDPEPFQLGGDLTTVVAGVIDNVAARGRWSRYSSVPGEVYPDRSRRA
jgi:hypothetical protein